MEKYELKGVFPCTCYECSDGQLYKDMEAAVKHEKALWEESYTNAVNRSDRLYQEIVELLESHFGYTIEDDNLPSDLDSLDTIEIVIKLERAYNITIDVPSDFFENVKKVSDIRNFLTINYHVQR